MCSSLWQSVANNLLQSNTNEVKLAEKYEIDRKGNERIIREISKENENLRSKLSQAEEQLEVLQKEIEDIRGFNDKEIPGTCYYNNPLI